MSKHLLSCALPPSASCYENSVILHEVLGRTLSNRCDLISAPKRIGNTGRTESSDCGEYRIVFARNSGKLDGLNRNLIIFEARVPNPEPAAGPRGCREIVEFWH